MVDVLTFVDAAPFMPSDEEQGILARQIAINGRLIAEPEEHSSLLHPNVFARQRREYLEQLLGDVTSGELEDGRIPLGYCPVCLGDDGWIYAVTMGFTPETVSWSRLGYDTDNIFFGTRTGPWWRRREEQPPADWTSRIVAPEDPELIYTFDRSDYERVIRAEIERLGKP